MKGFNIFLADGFEDIEALAPCDVLRRAGETVGLVSLNSELSVRSSHGVLVEADCLLEECDFSCDGLTSMDFMIFPGGMPGSRTLAGCGRLISAMRDHYASGGYVAAICAAPGLVLSQLDSLEGHELTCFDGFEDGIVARGGRFVRRPACRSGRIVTGRSAGFAFDFGLAVLETACGSEIFQKVRSQICLVTE